MDIQHVYNFTATFEDGSQIFHDLNSSDSSSRFEGKTLFTDVLFKCGQLDDNNPLFKDSPELLEEMKNNKLKLHSFVIHNDNYSVGVDLRDGHFELNGIPFFQHRPDLDRYKDFRVIYFRTVKHHMNALSGESISGEVTAYGVGWQTNDSKGNNVKRIIYF